MSRRHRGVLVLVLVCSATSAGAAEGILLLRQAGAAAREGALFQALRIYTRDLDWRLSIGAAAPSSLSAGELATVAAAGRQAGASLIAWFGGEPGGGTLYALVRATMDLRVTMTDSADPDGGSLALALKLRALLSRGPAGVGREWSPAAVATTLSGVAGPPATTPRPPVAGEVAGVAALGSPTAVDGRPATALAPVVAPPLGRRRRWIELGLGDRLDQPIDASGPTWLRHGATLRLGLLLARLPLAVHVDGGFTTRPAVTIDGHPVTWRAVPLGLALSLRLRRDRLLVAGGARLSLQILDAEARAPDGRVGAVRRYSAGVGAQVEGRLYVRDFVALALDATVEALLPPQRFTVDGLGGPDSGVAQFGFGAGVVFVVP